MRRSIAALLLALVPLTGVQAQDQPPIRIGAFLAATGPAALSGEPQAKTLRLFTDRINKAGGIDGRPLELVIHDTMSDPRMAVAMARRLIEETEAVLLIGGSTTGETMAAVPLVEAQGIPLISLAGANVIAEPVKKWVFKLPHSDRLAIEKIYADMKKHRWTRVAILGGTTGVDQSCRKEARALASRHGITITADESFGPADIEIAGQLGRIRGVPGLNAVLGCSIGVQAVIAARQYRQAGMRDIALYFTNGVGSQKFIDDAGDAATGIRAPLEAVLIADQMALDHPQRPVAEAFGSAYRAAYEEPASAAGGHAHDALMIAAAAIRRARNAGRAALRDAIEATKGHVGAAGIYAMSPRDHMGVNAESLRISEIREGAWKLAE